MSGPSIVGFAQARLLLVVGPLWLGGLRGMGNTLSPCAA